jgi:hypothetical protein
MTYNKKIDNPLYTKTLNDCFEKFIIREKRIKEIRELAKLGNPPDDEKE